MAIVDQGRVIAQGTPRELKQRSAGTTRIELRLARPEPDDGAGATGRRRGLPACPTAAYMLHSTRVPQTIVSLVKYLEAQGNELSSLEIAAPSLEDVFLELTGTEAARLKNAWTLTKVRMRLALRNRAFIFFSLVFPLIFLFLFLGLFARSNVAAVPYMLASVLALTVMGSFWGLSVQLVTFREQGILRRFRLTPVGAGAMLASSILSNYILTLPTVVIEFVAGALDVSHAGLGQPVGRVSAGDAGHRDVRRAGPDHRQRDEHHAGDADHQPDPVVGLSVPFRRHAAAADAAGVDPGLCAVPAGHLSGDGPRARDGRAAWALRRSAPN